MSPRPSIKDIARLAQVTPSTVSRALSGSGRISDATRRRVQTIAQELGYTPSVAARSLVTGASQTFGILAPTLSDPYVAAVMGGIEAACLDAGYHLVVASTAGNPRREIEAFRVVMGQQPDGLIILSARAGHAYEQVLKGVEAPVVFINSTQPGERVFSIATDNEYGGWLATRHLLDLGHRRIAYLGGPTAGRSHQARAAGYRRALQEAGLRFAPELVLPGDGSLAAGRAALARLLAQNANGRPTALFCYNDLSALGLLAEAHRRGLRLPDDLSVVGFDNVPYAEISLPPLTTVDQRKEELGRLAVFTLLAALRGEPVADIRLRGDLIVRESTAPPPDRSHV
jgi:DNA-binding LacI/PurR family transcriptional regulator